MTQSKKNLLDQVNRSMVIPFVIYLVAFAGSWAVINEKINNIERFMEEGDRFTQEDGDLFKELIHADNVRIAQLEVKFANINEKLDTIIEKLN